MSIGKLWVVYRREDGTPHVTDMREPTGDAMYRNVWARAEALAQSKGWTLLTVVATKPEANRVAAHARRATTRYRRPATVTD